MFVVALITGSCTKPEGAEPVSAGLTQSTPEPRTERHPIDPDQIALPPKADASANSISAVSSENAKAAAAHVDAPVPVATAEVSPASSRPILADVLPTPAPEEVESPTPSAESASKVGAEGPASHPASVSQGSGSQTLYIKATILTVRSQPNRYAKILGYLSGGTTVHVNVNGGWAKLDAGRWLRSRWLVKVKPTKFVGSDYRDESSKASSKASSKQARKDSNSRKKNVK